MPEIGYDIEKIEGYGTALFILKEKQNILCNDSTHEIFITKIDKMLFFKIKEIGRMELLPFSNIIKIVFFPQHSEPIQERGVVP